MPIQSLLVANRGEIAIRVMRAAAARGLRSVAVYSEDEAGALHTRKADAAQPLRGSGAAAYLDIEAFSAPRMRPAATRCTRATASCPRTPSSRVAVQKPA